MDIKAGSSFTRNGITVIVHSVDAKEVYYEKRPSQNVGKEWPQEDDFWPLHRMSVESFMSQVG